MSAPVIVHSPDLLLRQKLVNGIEALGRAAIGVSSGARLRERLAEGATALIVEMDAPGIDAVALIGALRADSSTSGLPVVGFCAHTREDLIDAARAAGATVVVSRGAVVRRLPTIMAALWETDDPDPAA